MTAATVPATTIHRLPRRLHGMAWVTWRQHRMVLAGVVALLGGFSILLLVNGLAMHHEYSRLGLADCGNLNGPTCAVPLSIFESGYQGWAQFLPRILEFFPAIIGLFVGAPLVAREFESGTFRFAWTQGRHRVRWVTVKLALLGGALTVLALGFSAVFGWWFTPFDALMGRMESGQAYEVAGVVFAARTLFAFTLGALLGAIIRRTVPAMAATGAGWLLVAWPSVSFLRPLIQAPLRVPESSNPITKGGWIISSWIQDPSGHHLNSTTLLERARTDGVTTAGQFNAWLSHHHYRTWVSYEPDGRFWHFQTIEAGGYLILAVILAALTIWWVRRRAA